jgi:hypothetical protein
MRPDISAAFLRAAKAQETEEAFIVLVIIEHDDLPAPIRLNNSGANIDSNGETFLRCPMQPTILDDDPDRPPQAALVVSNIDRTMIAALRGTLTPPEITMEIVKAGTPDYIEAGMGNLEMRNIEYDSMMIQGGLTPRKIKSQPAIDYNYTPSQFPGLFS